MLSDRIVKACLELVIELIQNGESGRTPFILLENFINIHVWEKTIVAFS